MSELTNLAAGISLLVGGGSLLAAASSYPAFARSPTPGFVISREAPLSSAKEQYTVAGLPTASIATVFLVLNKTPSVEDLRMMCAILTQNDNTRTWVGYTGRNYMYNGGVTANTYQPAFVNMVDKTVLDNGRTVLLTVVFTHGGVEFYLNGQLAAQESTGPLDDRPWSDQFVLGGETGSAYDWQGLISACYLYLVALSPADRQRTEAYLVSKYPQIS